MRPYSSVKALSGSSYTCFTGTQVLGQFAGTGPIYSKSCGEWHMKSNPKSSAPYFTLNETLPWCQGPRWVEFILVSQVLRYWGNLGKLASNTPNEVRGHTHKVIQSFQNHILHWMRSYSSVKAILGLIYTCFKVVEVLGQFGETGSQCPNFFEIFQFYYFDIWSFKFAIQNGFH